MRTPLQMESVITNFSDILYQSQLLALFPDSFSSRSRRHPE
ncbi:hypothetical protein [Coleofasciculus sp. FACHB-1120]|nr:hypothetical protein [Coleofasciculus sp. FACHB-1120]